MIWWQRDGGKESLSGRRKQLTKRMWYVEIQTEEERRKRRRSEARRRRRASLWSGRKEKKAKKVEGGGKHRSRFTSFSFREDSEVNPFFPSFFLLLLRLSLAASGLPRRSLPERPILGREREREGEESKAAMADNGNGAGPSNAATAQALALPRSAHGIVPQLQNTVATVNLDTRLDLKSIALHSRNSEYNPKVKEKERGKVKARMQTSSSPRVIHRLPRPPLFSPSLASIFTVRRFRRRDAARRAEKRAKEREASEERGEARMPPPPVESRFSFLLFVCRLLIFPSLSLVLLPLLSNQNSASPPSSCAFETRRRRR